MTEVVLPTKARVVVVGGGVIGCSVAYHLAHEGWSDVVLVERDRLTSGTTWHAAGLMVTFGSTSETSTKLRQYTRDLYQRLEAETGQSTGFMPVGFIEVATDADRLEEYRRVAAFNRACGVEVHELGPREVHERFPLARTDDVLAGFYVPHDGRANPVDVTMALAKGAKLKGARVLEGVTVLGVTKARGHVTGVDTSHGHLEADFVVNCAGIWGRQLGEGSGVNVPLQAAVHSYLITERLEGMSRALPVLEDPSSYGYYREEGGGLMVGLFEPVCAPWMLDGVPMDFSFGEIPPDWERLTPYLEKAMRRVPSSLAVGIKKLFCGPESFTPDLRPVVGEAPELEGYFVAAGLNSIGILTGGGLGRALAHWIITGSPDIDVTGFNVDRLHRFQANRAYLRDRTVEALGLVYQCHYPTRSMETARGAKRSVLHEQLKAKGASFRDVSGWEGADWYAPQGEVADPGPLSWGRQRWFPFWQAEHQAARQGVVLVDLSFMSKFLVQGRDAGRVLEHLSANRVATAPGVITYTQWLNHQGTLEADVTVTMLDDERFLVVATDTMHRHVETWIRRHLGAAHAFVTDVTSAFTQLTVQGPRSRELLQSLTPTDLSNQSFPFRAARELELGYARVLCTRLTYVGELGYELFIPTEQAAHVYERLVQAGEQVGLVHAGLKALNSLRLEKGYRDYGHDLDNTDTPYEVGLGFAVDLSKPGGFLGLEAAEAAKRAPLTRRLVHVLVKDPEPLLFHAEVLLREGRPVGTVRSGSYGFTLGGAVGLAMVEGQGRVIDEPFLTSAEWEVDIAGRRFPAMVSARPLYDPSNARIKR